MAHYPSKENQIRIAQIVELSDGVRTSTEIAAIVGSSAKYVQDIMLKRNLPRLQQGARNGDKNPSYSGGRMIDLDGYALVGVRPDHPSARKTQKKSFAVMYEHRLVVEKSLGRYLQAGEVVDHIDGIQLHNHPDNLRVFASNADHLKATISGQVPKWSDLAILKKNATLAQRLNFPLIDSYRSAKGRGDVRLRQILLALSRFGADSPYLLGSLHWLAKAHIYDYSRPNLELHLAELSQRYTLNPSTLPRE